MGIVAVPYFSYVMSNSSDMSLSVDANGDTASVTSSESTEANSDSKADLGLCMLWFKFTSSSNFFKLVHIFQTGLYFLNQFIFFKPVYFFWSSIYKKGKYLFTFLYPILSYSH